MSAYRVVIVGGNGNSSSRNTGTITPTKDPDDRGRERLSVSDGQRTGCGAEGQKADCQGCC